MAEETSGQSPAQNGDVTPVADDQNSAQQATASGDSNTQQKSSDIDLTKFASEKWNGGKASGIKSVLDRFGVESVEDLDAKVSEGKKAKKTVEKIDETPEFIELKRGFAAEKARADQYKSELQKVVVDDRLATVFKDAHAPGYAAYEFQKSYTVSLDDKGKAQVTDKDGRAIVRYQSDGDVKELSLEEVATEFFASRNDLKGTSKNEGASSTGNKANADGKSTESGFAKVQAAAQEAYSKK